MQYLVSCPLTINLLWNVGSPFKCQLRYFLWLWWLIVTPGHHKLTTSDTICAYLIISTNTYQILTTFARNCHWCPPYSGKTFNFPSKYFTSHFPLFRCEKDLKPSVVCSWMAPGEAARNLAGQWAGPHRGHTAGALSRTWQCTLCFARH